MANTISKLQFKTYFCHSVVSSRKKLAPLNCRRSMYNHIEIQTKQLNKKISIKK